MPWEYRKEFWAMYGQTRERPPLYPFSAEPIDEFVKSYAGKADVPIFASKLVVPVILLTTSPLFLKGRQSVFKVFAADSFAVCSQRELLSPGNLRSIISADCKRRMSLPQNTLKRTASLGITGGR